MGKGMILDDLGHHREALEAYDTALSLDPNDPKI
jgi:Flp pilus assembly protein TadD